MDARPDTIAAIATAPGRGGIGVVRVSGPLAVPIARAVTGHALAPRHATLCRFRGGGGEILDEGIALLFPGPRSYTGEDVLELQGHGGPVVLREIVRRCVGLGARLAEPGEFTRRAFLNDRLDLAQAEAVADLIDAASAEAARGAARSLAGEFSARIAAVVEAITRLRLHVEACIDFPEEEIDPADRAAQHAMLAAARDDLARLFEGAAQGAVLREGLTVVLVGRPNVGKSSLLNRLAGEEVAIVTAVAGTTRDPVRATIAVEGVPIHLIDTAGLRESGDEVERIGIARTWEAIGRAGAAILIEEASGGAGEEESRILARIPQGLPLARVTNKIDLAGLPAGRESSGAEVRLRLSARTGEGVAALRAWLLEVAGWHPAGEGIFLARERHLVALREAAGHLANAAGAHMQAFELFAEDLRLAQAALGRITGEVTADDLLGQIFSRFCIGK
ncbi:MAG: tRNA uridine-5-carboxymethylaminomethyl(34) synthesis GTPase MnmE [Burkholderiales bacterium]|nr:tRNA uridine-5-carboxymethylaminomethyl(34) synthesis GTPase MnmE [Burkholderiales bacterium]MBX3714965.1 tRNA uridine-5-carboxymethylaminomethyl(34) synthesis GTPase MnmE [Burkholderiales bacterium]